MDFRDLTLFVRIAQLSSISAAARDLGVTPAAASARLAAVEKGLGTRLVHRTTRMVTLTEDGRAFLPHAEHLLDGAATALAALGRGGVVERAVATCSGGLAVARRSGRARVGDLCRWPCCGAEERPSVRWRPVLRLELALVFSEEEGMMQQSSVSISLSF